MILFTKRPGAESKLDTLRSQFRADYGAGIWGMPRRRHLYRVYAKVTPKAGDGFVCRADRSPTIKRSSHPRSLGAQTATSSTGEPVDSTPPDLQLSGKKTRKKAGKAIDDGKNVKAKVTVKATDAAGNVATAKRTIRLAVAPGGKL